MLPVKRFDRAKQRLGASVDDALRTALARAMVADVLRALAEAESIERTIVVTREPAVAAAAREQGAIAIDDQAESGQPAAVTLGVRRALAEGFERVLCVPGDCPALDAGELDALLRAAPSGASERGEPEVVILPDRHGTGTNGLLLAPPDAIPPAFGPGSCERHRELALAAGISCRVQQLPSLLLDVDTGADLAALRERLSGHGARASHTRAVLGQPERTDVLPITTSA
ncbi:MAG: 2-phospho-L-lactate/phosphoenolpyruvate guanylyltransferase [Solirubrobacteraceae bacterium]|nr:2-phospho-L-lactate/phosphoenolpyruvate guanylyltransferase [Solirubrobacteraceae bacterium]